MNYLSKRYASVEELLRETELRKRVFLGGNYDNIAVLREIRKMIERCGFHPILALDVDMLEEEIHRQDLCLLSNCTYAIFEETFPAGELMELERAGDYPNIKRIYIFYQARFNKEEHPAQLSSMIVSMAQEIKGSRVIIEGYLDFEDLDNVISKLFGGG